MKLTAFIERTISDWLGLLIWIKAQETKLRLYHVTYILAGAQA